MEEYKRRSENAKKGMKPWCHKESTGSIYHSVQQREDRISPENRIRFAIQINKKRISKSWSIHKYGRSEAFRLAEEFRTFVFKEMEEL